MGKKKALKRKFKEEVKSKVYFWIAIMSIFFVWLNTVSAIAYADLEICKNSWPEAFHSSNGPVGFVLRMSK